MAQGGFRMSRCHAVEQFTLPSSVYGLARAAMRFSVIVSRTGRSVGASFCGSGESTGIDGETFPGGGEPSAVKSDFCSASVFATGTGATTGLFMPMTFAMSRNAACKAARKRRLSLNAHGIKDRVIASPSSPSLLVNLFREAADDPFVRRQELNAEDGLHPSDSGYRMWFDELMVRAALPQHRSAALAVIR